MDDQVMEPLTPHSHFQDGPEDKDERPFIPECELLYEGGPNALQLFQSCQKNRGHKNFIPVNEFSLEHLPPDYRTESMGKTIRMICDRTVKITVRCTSPKRPDTYPNSNAPYPYKQFKGSKRLVRVGTGYILDEASQFKGKFSGFIPCSYCKKYHKYRPSNNLKTTDRLVIVSTAAHVVFDDSEAENVECEMFYDTEERQGIIYLHGERILKGRSCLLDVDSLCRDDYVEILCICHDSGLDKIIDRFSPVRFIDIPFPVIVSHPHGRSKHVTIGKVCRVFTALPSKHSIRNVLKFEPHEIKCRLSENSQSSSEELLQELLGESAPCDQDTVYTFQSSLFVKLPINAQYLFQGLISKEQWITFPPETKFSLHNESNFISLPEVEFDVSSAFKNVYDNQSFSFYVEYDADTCQGSSGATVVIAGEVLHHCRFDLSSTHSGAIQRIIQINKSGQNQIEPNYVLTNWRDALKSHHLDIVKKGPYSSTDNKWETFFQNISDGSHSELKSNTQYLKSIEEWRLRPPLFS